LFAIQILRFDNIDSLDEAARLLEGSSILDEVVSDEDWPDHEPLTKRWNQVTGFDFGINELISGTRTPVRFIIAEGYNERTKRKDSWFEGEMFVPKEERINVVRYNSMFFEYEGSVFIAPLMPFSANINTYCSDLLPLEIWGTHQKEPSDYKLSKDFFYWLLNVFTRNNKLVSNNPSIRIRSWTGFHGTTQDTVHKLTGEGEQIAAILGTLAFLFMDDPFKSLSICIQYENERIPVHLWANGSLSIHEYEYEGMFANAYQDEKRRVLLSYFMYTEVLPELFKAYNSAKESDTWNEQVKEDFRNYIGDEIITRVRDELQI
jgi:hypothetical protein